MRMYAPTEADWTACHAPAADTQATCTKASAGAGRRNVCTGLVVMFAAGASAPTAVNVLATLINGASGGTTYLWEARLSLPAVAGSSTGAVFIPCWLVGSADTAMCLEFTAKGGSNTLESVSMMGTVL